MPKKRLGAEQIVTKLRQVEVLQSQSKSIPAWPRCCGTEPLSARFHQVWASSAAPGAVLATVSEQLHLVDADVIHDHKQDVRLGGGHCRQHALTKDHGKSRGKNSNQSSQHV